MTDALPHDQAAHRVRFDWGPAGADHVFADVAVVIDVLSFTTTLSVAVEHGIEVFPTRAHDVRAKELALRHGATLAVGRFEALGRRDGRHVSLSPGSLVNAAGIDRLVLPSPNGSAISAGYADAGATVVGACLRNATAVARHVADIAGEHGTVVVIAAGEQWPDGLLRPAVEDLWGAGAVLAALATAWSATDESVHEVLSPEARMAAAAFDAVRHRLTDELHGCASGLELHHRGFGADVEIAAALDVTDVVPRLVGTSYVAAPTSWAHGLGVVPD